ncbi:hypothetical protein [Halopseudomonas salegens]|uniref:hypothetical protein n=1 Tax=Halopseudomonas salegens TaxID=1434072 RepID=UPI0012FE0855|nr:hypothetical protein [Halopseudomonas salegens]
MAMDKHRQSTDDNNRASSALGRPIAGQLGKKRSTPFVVIFGVVALLVFWWIFTSQLGFKAGSGATLLLAVGVIAVSWRSEFLQSGNRKWKAFERDD